MLIIGIAVSASAATMLWFEPYIQEKKVTALQDSALNQLTLFDDAIQDLITQGPPCSRIINFVTDDGYIHIGKTDSTRFVIYYSIDGSFSFNVSGFDIDEEDYDEFQFRLSVYPIVTGPISSMTIRNLLTDEPEQDILIDEVKENYTDIKSEITLAGAIQISIKNKDEAIISAESYTLLS